MVLEWGLPLWSPIFSSTVTVVTSVSLLLGLKFWPEMKTKEKRIKATTKQQQNQNQKQTKANISKKLHGYLWKKSCKKIQSQTEIIAPCLCFAFVKLEDLKELAKKYQISSISCINPTSREAELPTKNYT